VDVLFWQAAKPSVVLSTVMKALLIWENKPGFGYSGHASAGFGGARAIK
jgi:hypothetical protein